MVPAVRSSISTSSMDGPSPTCHARRDGEVDLDLSDSSLPFSTSLLMDRGGMDGCLEVCLADGFLDI
eukprot:12909966-Prorocentrum_lima.AAC.1